MTPPAGTITRIIEVAASDGSWQWAAELSTGEGRTPVIGRLVGPPNGTAGPIGFVPVPEWQDAAGRPVPTEGGDELEELEEPAAAAPPAETPADPDDPRGIRPSSPTPPAPGTITSAQAPTARGL